MSRFTGPSVVATFVSSHHTSACSGFAFRCICSLQLLVRAAEKQRCSINRSIVAYDFKFVLGMWIDRYSAGCWCQSIAVLLLMTSSSCSACGLIEIQLVVGVVVVARVCLTDYVVNVVRIGSPVLGLMCVVHCVTKLSVVRLKWLPACLFWTSMRRLQLPRTLLDPSLLPHAGFTHRSWWSDRGYPNKFRIGSLDGNLI
jgi:hypothetical protein